MRTKPPFRLKLDEFTGVIDAILAADKDRPKKQRHTSKRIFARLRDEHGFTGKITIVKDYVAGWRQRTQEMFVPLVHPPGHAQDDFGEAIGVIGGVERRENIIAVGNSGTGKSHIALGLGLAACQKGLSVGFITASALVHELLEARDEKRLLRLQRQLARYKLLIIDELGYVPLSATGAELLFEVFSQRYERGSTLVTSNLPFDEWTSVFGSERLTGALLDRLTHHVHILEMNGDSFRLAHSKRRSRRARSEPPSDAAPQECGGLLACLRAALLLRPAAAKSLRR